MPTEHATDTPRRRALGLLALFAGLAAVQSALVANPGYFSHDELQWAVHARLPAGPGTGWTDWEVFQWRPLTFQLWRLLSNAFFAHPPAFHAVFVLAGTLNALLLAGLLRLHGQGRRVAAGAALLFVLHPQVAYVHGWVGTLGDLLWVAAGLLAALGVSRLDGARVGDAGGHGVAVRPEAGAGGVAAAAGVGAAATVVGLLAKESALSIPALLAIGWALSGVRRAWLAATLGAGVVALAYLGLRWDAILGARPETTAYGWNLATPPVRWLEYQLFPFLAQRFEPVGMLAESMARLAIAALAALLAVAALWRVRPRWAMALLAAGVAAPGPVLLLDFPANQYGYGLAAATAAGLAIAFARSGRGVRLMLLLPLALLVLHGARVQWEMLAVGRFQAAFSPALAEAARGHDRDIRLWSVDRGADWRVQRLAFDIPSYAGVALGQRVVVVAEETAATHRVLPDGRLEAIAR